MYKALFITLIVLVTSLCIRADVDTHAYTSQFDQVREHEIAQKGFAHAEEHMKLEYDDFSPEALFKMHARTKNEISWDDMAELVDDIGERQSIFRLLDPEMTGSITSKRWTDAQDHEDDDSWKPEIDHFRETVVDSEQLARYKRIMTDPNFAKSEQDRENAHQPPPYHDEHYNSYGGAPPSQQQQQMYDHRPFDSPPTQQNSGSGYGQKYQQPYRQQNYQNTPPSQSQWGNNNGDRYGNQYYGNGQGQQQQHQQYNAPPPPNQQQQAYQQGNYGNNQAPPNSGNNGYGNYPSYGGNAQNQYGNGGGSPPPPPPSQQQQGGNYYGGYNEVPQNGYRGNF